MFGFLGPNGAGKTTTLKLLMQLVFPTVGPRGDPRPAARRSCRSKRRIGYLPENPYFYDYLTAEELLVYFAALFGIRGAERRARAARLLDEVGIGAERRLQLRKFSKGMLQRVGIAQALLNDPELVILDEPMSGLDPLGRRDVRALILRLRDKRLHGVLQLARPERRRGALQPRGDSREGPAGRRRAGSTDMLAFRRARLGAGRRRRAAEALIASLGAARAARRAHRRRALHARAAARPAARAAARRARRPAARSSCR